ncbi:tetratricopeptide repeat protein [Chroogloeocystis siderophila]|uniref:Tetratricopeptide repeat-like domain-containing protein n=1 Tax=Chroogloeocystis siderophila 5.2 s.c.1 TaxID=247279 RepID=A0A1U7HZ06_9CHRO|nr:tetratricopeptide repeat protein [Chroogloeocystis siderophila]OKH28793.1 hypothetical protein NIES1031_02530 [Chroogloeocystis siderophila 5.2 s.c.1]
MDAYQKTSRKRFQQIVTWVSIIAFFGSTVYAAIGAINQAVKPTNNTVVSPESQLPAQARGYEVVLQREPNNQAALEGLALTQLQMNNPNAAIAPLEKLVQLHPGRQDYQNVLAQVKQANQK